MEDKIIVAGLTLVRDGLTGVYATDLGPGYTVRFCNSHSDGKWHAYTDNALTHIFATGCTLDVCLTNAIKQYEDLRRHARHAMSHLFPVKW